ncbi:chromosome partitioning protein, ParB family [Novimethylophilus kurashikiensis]|uniref:Chromosome partitioning protein, ParB family n=1 Tax=Novimethylophilus kurashikiensis TaxID=1825523 RepID=A0A2R5F407_9PROT|nr:plasmid partitioning protein RepB C-terminal domain-containing protein [Novimethylophilus kurashikiensis]GBG12995.1 chromosome partitioning protein, ParB family [Novimethylophilus kurashikiensis]
MTHPVMSADVRMIPINRIHVLNPRERNGKIFSEIVGNIKAIGLKKPITVTPRGEQFLLVCGEGRLKAYLLHGESHIPAIIVEVSDEDAFIMSLAENIARRQCRPLELLEGIRALFDKGYNTKQISEKTGLTFSYVQDILTLLLKGEERLLVAVQTGRIPLRTAMTIVGAGDDGHAVQSALQDAYESGTLRGKQLQEARRVIERRQTLGRTISKNGARKSTGVSSASLIRTYQKEVSRQKIMVKKAEFTQQRLLFVIGALRQLLANENFVNLLRAEGLDTLPQYLAEQVWPSGVLA